MAPLGTQRANEPNHPEKFNLRRAGTPSEELLLRWRARDALVCSFFFFIRSLEQVPDVCSRVWLAAALMALVLILVELVAQSQAAGSQMFLTVSELHDGSR